MSLRYEQYASLLYSRDMLRDLCRPDITPRVPRPVRQRAANCLRHFPFLDEFGKPYFSQDEITKD